MGEILAKNEEEFALWLSDKMCDLDEVEWVDEGGYGKIVVHLASGQAFLLAATPHEYEPCPF